MKVNKSKTIEAYIPTSSMADIAFLLIIFFMVSSVFPMDKTQMEAATTDEIAQYNEDSAIISITTDRLITVREDINKTVSSIYGQPEKILIKSTAGKAESQTLYEFPAATWDMMDEAQFETLKNKVTDFVREVERRRETEERQVIIILKSDRKTPFFAIDGVIKVLQEIGGDSAQGIAIITKLAD